MADLDTNKIWFHKYCENIWITGMKASVNEMFSLYGDLWDVRY